MRALAFIAILAFAAPAAAAEIGVVSAATSRMLPAGRELQLGKRIVTGPDDRLDLLFVDGTSVTVGANSALVIDRFDRSGSSSELVLSAERGTFRLVGGAPGGDRIARIVTPSTTVDLKNGIATVEVGDRGVVATLPAGQFDGRHRPGPDPYGDTHRLADRYRRRPAGAAAGGVAGPAGGARTVRAHGQRRSVAARLRRQRDDPAAAGRRRPRARRTNRPRR